MLRENRYEDVRPQIGDGSFRIDFALALVSWYDRQKRRGLSLAELPPISDDEAELLRQAGSAIRFIAYNVGLLPRLPKPADPSSPATDAPPVAPTSSTEPKPS